MEKTHVETDVISLNPVNKMSKDGAKIKCRGPLFLSNSFGKVRSRYLREPIGSCHNLCKYGRKHESEHDEKRLTFRRFMDSIALETEQNLVKGPDTKKKMVIKMEPSDTAKVVEQSIQPEKVGISDNSVDTNMLALLSKHRRSVSSPQFILVEDSRRRTGSLAKKIGFFDNSINTVSEVQSPTYRNIESFESKSMEISPRVILPELQDKEINQVKFLNGSKNEKKVDKPMASSMPKSTPVKSIILKQKNSSASTEADSGGNTNIFEEKVLSNPKESNASTTVEMIKEKNIVIRKQSASSKLQSTNQNASPPTRKTNSYATPAIPLNVSTPPIRSISQLNTSRSMNGRMNRDEKSLNNNEVPDVGETKLLKLERTSISSTIPAGGTVSLKARKSRYGILKKSGKTKDDSGDFKEKVIEPKIDGKGLERRKNLSKEPDGQASNYAVCEASENSLNGQIQRKFKRSTASKEENNSRARRAPAVQQPADASSSSYKLKFKRGKVIELRTADSAVPKRLRFKRGRVLGENPSGEVTKRSFRRKRDMGNSNEHNSEARADMLKKANLESKVGMLKYQDAQGKKKIRALFNHMIEETANQLVETRKSKVKALVDAFETVISLQEAKSASTV